MAIAPKSVIFVKNGTIRQENALIVIKVMTLKMEFASFLMKTVKSCRFMAV